MASLPRYKFIARIKIWLAAQDYVYEATISGFSNEVPNEDYVKNYINGLIKDKTITIYIRRGSKLKKRKRKVKKTDIKIVWLSIYRRRYKKYYKLK